MNMQSFATALVVATFIETTLLMVLKLRQRNPKVARGSILLDTSSIMDGRIVDVARSGVITAEIIIPRSVVRELQLLADKADHDKRLRARKGLDNIRVLQRMDAVSVAIVNDGLVDSGGVDERLLELAQKYDASIATTDYNLNKVAKVINLTVINVNELSQMLRAQLLPGERIEVELIQPGANRDQAVGYLEDGTMVVVEDAKAQIGHRLTVEIVRSLQTEAGRMMFAKKVRTTGQNEPNKSKRNGEEAKSTRLASAFHSDQLAKKRPGRHNQPKHIQANQTDGSDDDEVTKKQPRRPRTPRRQSNSTATEAEMVRLANK
ncbi:PIN/TRAM domain-containing protein [Candidatus Nanoperiomorbus periodonticus]|uniref:PIN/TRAM domain-containing protein n=1 Tax=Candidatus Nanoperiomorbus periodonticus TaxID=2171989 RepID=UPI00101B9149|nr:TRAM domain-containing protein [Candidatus Nanoperiomorbus periodonticus]RYC75982.1 putative PIN and TRAM-domain containing protein YacL [Candidatus Nanoperiomorbus periodonticus]